MFCDVYLILKPRFSLLQHWTIKSSQSNICWGATNCLLWLCFFNIPHMKPHFHQAVQSLSTRQIILEWHIHLKLCTPRCVSCLRSLTSMTQCSSWINPMQKNTTQQTNEPRCYANNFNFEIAYNATHKVKCRNEWLVFIAQTVRHQIACTLLYPLGTL